MRPMAALFLSVLQASRNPSVVQTFKTSIEFRTQILKGLLIRRFHRLMQISRGFPSALQTF